MPAKTSLMHICFSCCTDKQYDLGIREQRNCKGNSGLLKYLAPVCRILPVVFGFVHFVSFSCRFFLYFHYKLFYFSTTTQSVCYSCWLKVNCFFCCFLFLKYACCFCCLQNDYLFFCFFCVSFDNEQIQRVLICVWELTDWLTAFDFMHVYLNGWVDFYVNGHFVCVDFYTCTWIIID